MTYPVMYAVAWIVAATAVIAGILAASIAAPNHPSWLTSDVASTCGLIAAICGGLAAFLPQVQRTPDRREAKYLDATAGILPSDLAEKHADLTTK